MVFKAYDCGSPAVSPDVEESMYFRGAKFTFSIEKDCWFVQDCTKGVLEEKETQEMLENYSVSVWDVDMQNWLCWDEPFVGNEKNIRAWIAKTHDIEIELLDNYDWQICRMGSVRKSLEE